MGGEARTDSVPGRRCREGSPQDVHAIEVILGQGPASFSVAGPNLHPPLLHAVFGDYGSTFFVHPEPFRSAMKEQSYSLCQLPLAQMLAKPSPTYM